MAVLQWHFPPLIEALKVKKPSPPQIHFKLRNPGYSIVHIPEIIISTGGGNVSSSCSCYSETKTFSLTSEDEYDEDNGEDEEEEEEEEDELEVSPLPSTAASSNGRVSSRPPFLKKRKRYRKAYPGETKGITEEMRFVAMKLRNKKSVKSLSEDQGTNSDSASYDEDKDGGEDGCNDKLKEASLASDLETSPWQPSMDGFANFMVDSKLVFETLERIVEESDDVAYAYFGKTGLERSQGLAKDIEWLRGSDVEIPEPSEVGSSYAKYLEELASTSAPSFLTHFYNVHFSHVSGGQVIVKQVSEKIFDGREMEFCTWDGGAQDLLKDAREKLNKLSEHWSRSDKNKCLSEASKCFKHMGEIVRLIIS